MKRWTGDQNGNLVALQAATSGHQNPPDWDTAKLFNVLRDTLTVWINAEWFYDFVAKTPEDLIERLDNAHCWPCNAQ